MWTTKGDGDGVCVCVNSSVLVTWCTARATGHRVVYTVYIKMSKNKSVCSVLSPVEINVLSKVLSSHCDHYS